MVSIVALGEQALRVFKYRTYIRIQGRKIEITLGVVVIKDS